MEVGHRRRATAEGVPGEGGSRGEGVGERESGRESGGGNQGGSWGEGVGISPVIL